MFVCLFPNTEKKVDIESEGGPHVNGSRAALVEVCTLSVLSAGGRSDLMKGRFSLLGPTSPRFNGYSVMLSAFFTICCRGRAEAKRPAAYVALSPPRQRDTLIALSI